MATGRRSRTCATVSNYRQLVVCSRKHAYVDIELWLISCRQSPIFELPLVLSRRKVVIRQPLHYTINFLWLCIFLGLAAASQKNLNMFKTIWHPACDSLWFLKSWLTGSQRVSHYLLSQQCRRHGGNRCATQAKNCVGLGLSKLRLQPELLDTRTCSQLSTFSQCTNSKLFLTPLPPSPERTTNNVDFIIKKLYSQKTFMKVSSSFLLNL